ncbi:MAG: ABC transporter ATP-binding protein/permease [Drouetiella hepatica Uher 2000/2452]|jgi:ABC-type multidrug transport system fused ATPase/permease subunit|uniref:histidine kinase n=1 Tax=Drouetiella hepatica Uher 2000/2452 TaxID=904376 RepID=A0A951QCX8_9CYAN|nr:ABC transporter ATP-binding protein/permease [Drouetiella hepatica Uher 2000/2452]
MSSRHLLSNLAQRYPGLISLNVALGFSGALFNGISTALIIPVLLSFLGEPIATKGLPPVIQALLSPFVGGSGQQNLLLMTSAIILLLLFKNIAAYANALVSGALKRTLSNDLRERGLRLLLDVDIDFYVKTGIGDIINRLNNEVSRAASAIATLTRTVTVSITVLVFVSLLLALSWQLTIVSTALLAVVASVNQYSIGRSKQFGKELSESSRAYSTSVLDLLSGMRLVRCTANETHEYQRLKKLIGDREEAEFKAQAVSALIDPVSEMTGIVALLLIVLIGRSVLGNQVEAFSAVLLTYLFLLFRTLPLIAQLNGARSQLANISPSIEIASDFLRQDNKPFMKNGSIPFTALKQGIHFQNLSLTYPGQKKPVLSEVDLHLPKNTTLALVGSSGAGKSTLADLLPRFYDPTQGCILIDGQDLRSLDFKSLRRSMGIVSQDTFLFNASIRDNIAYGCADATDSAIMEAAKQANAHEFILQLPQGFDTQIGDRGVLLSGGQRQRIAIARALLQNPEILILDEATSALDTVSERLVQEAIDHLSRDRTTLVIAHRLSTVQKADQIAVMDQGRVVELGSHQQLMAKNGYYARLCDMQFEDKTQIKFELNQTQLAKTSHQFRTLLNGVIGLLGLMIDGIVETPEEQQEYTQGAYYSALNLIKSLERLEHDPEKPQLEESLQFPAQAIQVQT